MENRWSRLADLGRGLAVVPGRFVRRRREAPHQAPPAADALEAERRARQAEGRLLDAIESMPEAFALYDPDDRLVLCNTRYRELVSPVAEDAVPGVSFEHLTRRYAAARFAGEPAGLGEAWIVERLAHHRAAPSTHQSRRGETWFDIIERRTEDGGTLVVAVDVSEAKAREARLKELVHRNAMLAEAVAFTQTGVTITDPNLPGHPIVFVNPAFTRMTGYTAEEAIGRNCRLLQGRDTDPKTVERLTRAVRARRPVTVTIRNYRKDGRTFWNELTLTPIFDEHRQLIRYVGIQIDVTDRMRAEEALRRSEMKQRELALTLSAAKEQAEVASRSKSEFLANMSHELRTPLNAILGFAEVMQQEMLGPIGQPKYKEYAKDIHDSGALLLTIINDVLDLSKIEAGKLVLNPAEIDLPGLVKACFRLVRDRAKEGGVALGAELAADLPALYADERALEQMLINLLSNAVKFTPAGGRVTVTAARDGDGFAIGVADTGVGIAEKDIATALAPFGQVENALTRKHRGTGLGLPLVRLLAELHGGSLDLESKPGAGTTATIRLPGGRGVLAA